MAENEKTPAQGDNTVLNVIIGVAVLVAVAFFVFAVMSGGGSSSTGSGDEVPAVSETDHVKGAEDADITVIEYGDFQCPACKNYAPLLDRLVEENDNVAVAFRHFPLESVHPNAKPAAQAAEAAAKQDAFWKYHDTLYEQQDEWSEIQDPKDKFAEYAGNLDLDTEQFRADMTSEEIKNAVSEQARTARQAGLQKTPTLVVDGRVLDSRPGSYQELEQAVLNASGEATESSDDAGGESPDTSAEESGPSASEGNNQ